MQFLGVLVLMGLGWVFFEGDPTLIGWVFVGVLLLQVAWTSRRMARRLGGRRRGIFLSIFGRGHSRRVTSVPRSRGSRHGYSAPSARRGPRSWIRPAPAGRTWTGSPR